MHDNNAMMAVNFIFVVLGIFLVIKNADGFHTDINNNKIVTQERKFSIDYDQNTFVKDGKPFRYISASIHYFRVPPIYWEDRLYKIRKAGLNAIQMYVPWNSHEMFKGSYNFEDELDLVGFIKLAQAQGLLVIFRPGPYIDTEWEYGGFPYWLIKEVATKIRTADSQYMALVDKWFSVLLPKIKPLLYENGGPIISIQVENEYGSYGCDHNYMKQMQGLIEKYLGTNVVLFTTDGAGDSYLKCGAIPSLYTTVDFGPGGDVKGYFNIQRKYQSKGPLVNSEYYTGWFDHWGDKHHKTDPQLVTTYLDKILAMNASVNMYMFEGGTNFNLFNGGHSGYAAVTTSYGYDAPLTESGDPTEKYFLIQKVISKYAEIPPGPQPVPTMKAAYGKILISHVQSFYDSMKMIKPYTAESPLSMEDVDLAVGYMMYRTNITGISGPDNVLEIKKFHDRAIVKVDEEYQGTLNRNYVNKIIIQAGDTLDIFVENEGRICVGHGMTDTAKGILSNVTVNGKILSGWKMYPYGFRELNPRMLKEQLPNMLQLNDIPDLPKAPFTAEAVFQVKEAKDTFLKLDNWSKGFVMINGQLLQKYWTNAGPQKTFYVPKSVFNFDGVNRVTIFEIDRAPSVENTYIEFVDVPEFGE